MPFELTHLAVGIQTQSNLSPSFLAGLIYPDVRYPAKLDRLLTHSMEPLQDCEDAHFVAGVRCHLLTDQIWDELFSAAHIQKPDPQISNAIFTGVCKLMHDRVSYEYLQNTLGLQRQLTSFSLPKKLPVAQQQWSSWIEALNHYIAEGPTRSGWIHIVTSMNFQSIDEITPRIVLLEQIYPKVKDVFIQLHQELIERIGKQSAGVTRS